MALKTYDPARVNLVLAGQPINGFAPGTFITITPVSQVVKSDKGVDNEPCRWFLGDPFSQLVFQLMQTASSNNGLSNLLNLDRVTGASYWPVLLEDRSNPRDSQPLRVLSAQGWLEEQPAIVRGDTVQSVKWTVRMVNSIFDTRGLGATPTTNFVR
jgi:hypothetical protein